MAKEVHGTINDIMMIFNLSLTTISKELDIPYRTLQNWFYGVSNPPQYVINLISSYYAKRFEIENLKNCNNKLFSDNSEIFIKLEKAQDLLHDKRFSEAIEIIDNI